VAPATGVRELKKILVVIGQLTATIVVTWFVASQAGLSLDQLRGIELAAWNVRWGVLAASCGALLLGYFANAYLWGRIVSDLGGPPIPPTVSVRLFMIANLGRYVPGKVWQIAGLVALARQRGVSGSTATAAAILGQGIGLASATLIGLGSIWVVADGASWRWILPVVVLGSVALGLLPPVFHAVVGAWFRVAKGAQPDGLAPARAAAWLAMGLGTWIVYALAFWALVEGLGLEVSILPTASAFAAAYVLGYVMVFAPAGIGVREGFLVALMAPQLGAGIAGAIAVVARLWTTVIEVVPAAAFWARHVAKTHQAREADE